MAKKKVTKPPKKRRRGPKKSAAWRKAEEQVESYKSLVELERQMHARTRKAQDEERARQEHRDLRRLEDAQELNRQMRGRGVKAVLVTLEFLEFMVGQALDPRYRIEIEPRIVTPTETTTPKWVVLGRTWEKKAKPAVGLKEETDEKGR